MTTVIADVCTDAWVAHKHWQQGQRLYFGLTIAFIFVPSCVISLLSLRWWFIQQCPPGHEEFRMSTRLTVVLHVFLLAVVYRYLSALIFGFKSQDRSRNKADRCAYHLLMLWEGNDASLLRVVESALESVPQVLLQSYVLITAQEQEPSVVLAQVGSIGFGVGSAAWSLVAYVRTLRFSREDSLNVSWLATVVCYCSHLMVLTPRLTALALFSSVFHWWTLLVCGIPLAGHVHLAHHVCAHQTVREQV
nr:XK-related protein 7-like [Rhipicephalus microplus]